MTALYKILLVILFVYTCKAQDPLGTSCNKGYNNSHVSANIKHLLPKLVSKAALTGYSAASVGEGQDRVYGLAQCRGDVSRKDCSSCLQDAATKLPESCSGQVDARIWYDYCFLRYDTEDFIGKVDSSVNIFYYNVEYVTDIKDFDKKVGKLIHKIESQAVVPKNEGLGKGENKLSPFETLYALVQCTRDLAPIDCAQCLAIAVGNFPTYCSNRKGCRALYSSCYVRFELYPFFFPLDPTNSSVPSNTSVAIIHS